MTRPQQPDPAAHSGLTQELARFLGHQASTCTAQLIERHRNDGTGHCRVCTAGGQTGRLTWPCQIYTAAAASAAGRPAGDDHPPAPGTRTR